MRPFKRPTYRSDPARIEEMNAAIRKMSASGKLLINPPENRRSGEKIIFNSVSWLGRDLAKNLDHITKIEWFGERRIIHTGLHNIYQRALFILMCLTILTEKFRVTAAAALEKIIEFLFTGAFPKKEERDSVLKEIMSTYRELPIWVEKTNLKNRTPEARTRAFPLKSKSNVYRAKQVWVELNFGSGARFNGSHGFDECARIYRSLLKGESFTSNIPSEKKTLGRPRGAISRAIIKNGEKAA